MTDFLLRRRQCLTNMRVRIVSGWRLACRREIASRPPEKMRYFFSKFPNLSNLSAAMDSCNHWPFFRWKSLHATVLVARWEVNILHVFEMAIAVQSALIRRRIHRWVTKRRNGSSITYISWLLFEPLYQGSLANHTLVRYCGCEEIFENPEKVRHAQGNTSLNDAMIMPQLMVRLM